MSQPVAATMRHFSSQRGPGPHHNATQAVRAHLGLTQDDLAYLMDVSRSAVAMDERGERTLPWPQVQLLYALRQALPAAPPPPGPALPTAADRDDLDFRRQQLRVAAVPLTRQLERLEVQLGQARCWQQVLPALRAAFPAGNAHAHGWLDRFERRAAATLRDKAGSPALLRIRLAAMAFEVAEITRLLGDEPPPPG